jgi:serine/threonine protein kinase
MRGRVMGGLAEFEIGEVFAQRYLIERVLGEGDRKRTYLAKDKKLERLVALSFVKPDAVLSDPDGTEREARVLGRIGSHDNIVSLYDYEISAGGSAEYMIFEYLSGGTLAEYLRETGPMPVDALLRLGRHLCRGLSHLHGRGLIHRDVSPDNIWLDERCVAHLGDFDSAVTVTASGGLLPLTTASFASPEERHGRSLYARSDLFSLGGVLYVAATGARFPGDLGLLSQRSDLPSAFSDLVASLVADSPADRPADADGVLGLLDVVRHASNIGALIAAGEGDRLEFKSSLHHAYGPLPDDLQRQIDQQKMQPAQAQKEMQKRLNKAVTKTLAAFLNGEGGSLLIGVDDSGTVLGIEADFPHLRQGKQNADGWLLSIREVITNAVGPEAWSAIHVSVVRDAEAMVVVVQCPPRQSETWHHEDRAERFYIRASNATHELSGPSLVRYIRERWPR